MCNVCGYTCYDACGSQRTTLFLKIKLRSSHILGRCFERRALPAASDYLPGLSSATVSSILGLLLTWLRTSQGIHEEKRAQSFLDRDFE